MPNKAGAINSMVDLVLHYQNHVECAVFAVTSLDLLDSPPLAFPHREALYKDNQSSGRALEEEHRGEFGGVHKLELPDKAVQVGDWIYTTTVHLPPSVTEIQASQTTFQQLAQAFAANVAPQEFQDVILPYFHVFEDVFSKALFDSLPEAQDKLNAFLQENLDSGHIHLSKSLMASPVFFIKKDSSLQLVQDYQVLNAITSVWYFTKLDVWWGYNNMHIQEGDKWKATFQTNWGLFELLVMFFGLTNSPATFQTMMNDIFQDFIAEGVVCVYLNDILIYTKMLEEHCWITCLILEQLHQHQLYLKLEKCKFEQTQIEYLSLTILHRAMEMDPVKVAGVVEWPEPKNKKEDFLHHAHLLFNLTGKDVTWSWGPPEQVAFDALKHTVTSGPILLFPDDNSPFWVEADSSDFATGAVLS
ncbi:hypothetical protein E4T56_gene11314 [Termitomyces sp. T112]|nr:hypothetical protein E4T56_gene11314 [Termitomyces sp. T112]